MKNSIGIFKEEPMQQQAPSTLDVGLFQDEGRDKKAKRIAGEG